MEVEDNYFLFKNILTITLLSTLPLVCTPWKLPLTCMEIAVDRVQGGYPCFLHLNGALLSTHWDTAVGEEGVHLYWEDILLEMTLYFSLKMGGWGAPVYWMISYFY